MDNNIRYDNFRRLFAFLLGVAVLVTSLYFSKTGFAFSTNDPSIWWVGWVLALAVTAAQFMFNTQIKELDWTIVTLGIVAYLYSIWSNIQGFNDLRGTLPNTYDALNILGGIFMDVFPEKAIAWSLGVIKAGDLFGNILSVVSNPGNVTNERNTQPKQTNTPARTPTEFKDRMESNKPERQSAPVLRSAPRSPQHPAFVAMSRTDIPTKPDMDDDDDGVI